MEFYSENSNINTDNIKPCYKTIYELEKYLLINYNADLIEEIDERTLKFCKYNIINAKLPLLFQETIGTDSAEYRGEDKLLLDIEVINNLPKSKLDLDIVQYKFDVIIEDVLVGNFDVIIERTTEYVNPSFHQLYDNDYYKNKLMAIMVDIILYQGVTKKDIDTKSERFIKYVTTKDYFKRYL